MTVKEAMDTAKEAEKIANKANAVALAAEKSATITLIKQDEHEKVCAERYAAILDVHKVTHADIKSLAHAQIKYQNDNDNRLRGYQNAVTGLAVVIILALIGTIFTLTTR